MKPRELSAELCAGGIDSTNIIVGISHSITGIWSNYIIRGHFVESANKKGSFWLFSTFIKMNNARLLSSSTI